ncbi:GNAT family N-acetyltransferase [Pseudonocardia kunmingensis]|uniref:RimJ/RimL family protein N-acetyltransferase n=1 Tax=Pseudonocardia kunmingensis TaxID=630975 RepID=A0A543DR54_9PSEU|nr:RimJ/RimL family protein N-acetyltransferase [Pseudonocardia kunmingensis]
MTISASRARPVAASAPPSVERPGPIGRKVRLREIRPVDRSTLIGFDRASVRDQPSRVGGYRHWAVHRASAARDRAPQDDDVQFAIEALHGGMLVGSICTLHAVPASGRFSYGVGIGARHRRCGYAGDAVATLLAFMFAQRGYHWCDVGIHSANIASLTLHSRLGFEEVDRVRDTELVHGGVASIVLMSITAAQFAALHPDRSAGLGQAGPTRGRHWRSGRGRHWNATAPAPWSRGALRARSPR